jgi:hypothetical protein
LSALIGELSGMHGTSRRLIQDFCHSVLHIPMSLGVVQKIVDRVSESLVPHDELIAELARQAPATTEASGPCGLGVQWHKCSLGTASEKGNRWVGRILSLKETCRLRTVSTYEVLVDAVSSFFHGQLPDLAWLQ